MNEFQYLSDLGFKVMQNNQEVENDVLAFVMGFCDSDGVNETSPNFYEAGQRCFNHIEKSEKAQSDSEMEDYIRENKKLLTEIGCKIENCQGSKLLYTLMYHAVLKNSLDKVVKGMLFLKNSVLLHIANDIFCNNEDSVFLSKEGLKRIREDYKREVNIADILEAVMCEVIHKDAVEELGIDIL